MKAAPAKSMFFILRSICIISSSFLFIQSSSATPPAAPPQPLMVPLTLLPPSAASKGAVCLDGTLPAYHLHHGNGAGANSWLVNLEGGGWCYNIRDCIFRKTTRRGSSKYMEKELPFTAMMSEKANENPNFFNWNRVKIRYCDGASFKGQGENEARGVYFRGQQIWLAVIDELMSKGMKDADQVLLAGCSAGGLAAILHCDEFRGFFPNKTRVKCLSDAGLFLDATDVSGGRTLRNFFNSMVQMQGVANNLPKSCTDRLDPTSCFFPQNLVADIKTPLFLLNAAYDTWQFRSSLAPPSANPDGSWKQCRDNNLLCNATQIQFLQDFRDQMLNVTSKVQVSSQNGVFINSCFAHCQTEKQDTWYAEDSPRIGNKRIAEAVGDWYFEIGRVEAIDCPYPCDKTCHHLYFNSSSKVSGAVGSLSELDV